MRIEHSPTATPTPRSPARWRWPEIGMIVVIIAVVVLIRTTADRWSLSTLIAYGPRWVWLVPPAVTIAIVFARRRRIAWIAAAALGIAAVFLLDFNVPRNLFASPREPARSQALRIVTCNVNGARTDGAGFDSARFDRWIDEVQPDVVALQECLPTADVSGLQRRLPFVEREGEQLIASRFPLRRIGYWNSRAFDGAGFILGVEVQAPAPFPVYAIHLETPRLKLDVVSKSRDENLAQLKDNLDLRRRVAADARDWILRAEGPAVIVGDFNTVADSPLYARNWSTFGNAFDEAGWGFGDTKNATWWRVRIDHVLHEVNWQATRCRAGPDVGSDHYPVVADLRLALP